MLASIHPLGERARGNRWVVTVSWYVAGSTAGGATVGGLLGSTGLRVSAVTVALLCLVAAVIDGSGRRLPSLHRQVNEDWLTRYRGWVYGVGFGFQLGAGAATIVTTAAVYLTFVLAAVSGSAAAGAIIGAAFGLARALPLLTVARVDRAGPLRRIHARLTAASRWAKVVTIVGLVGVAAGGLR